MLRNQHCVGTRNNLVWGILIFIILYIYKLPKSCAKNDKNAKKNSVLCTFDVVQEINEKKTTSFLTCYFRLDCNFLKDIIDFKALSYYYFCIRPYEYYYKERNAHVIFISRHLIKGTLCKIKNLR